MIQQRTSEEIAEIERHKYFLSEHRGYDVGWDLAQEDWDQHHGPSWRRQRENGSGNGEPEAHVSVANGAAASPPGEDVDVRRLDRAAPKAVEGARGPYWARVQQFFSRVFARSG